MKSALKQRVRVINMVSYKVWQRKREIDYFRQLNGLKQKTYRSIILLHLAKSVFTILIMKNRKRNRILYLDIS